MPASANSSRLELVLRRFSAAGFIEMATGAGNYRRVRLSPRTLWFLRKSGAGRSQNRLARAV